MFSKRKHIEVAAKALRKLQVISLKTHKKTMGNFTHGFGSLHGKLR